MIEWEIYFIQRCFSSGFSPLPFHCRCNMPHSSGGKRTKLHTLNYNRTNSYMYIIPSVSQPVNFCQWMSDSLEWMPLNMQLFSVAYTYSTSSDVLSHICDVAGITIFHLQALCIRATSTFNNYLEMHWLSWKDTLLLLKWKILYILSVYKWAVSVCLLVLRHFKREHFSFETYSFVCFHRWDEMRRLMSFTRYRCRYFMHFDTFLFGKWNVLSKSFGKHKDFNCNAYKFWVVYIIYRLSSNRLRCQWFSIHSCSFTFKRKCGSTFLFLYSGTICQQLLRLLVSFI